MWEIRSSVIGYHLYRDGELIADVYGFYKDWVEVVKRLNDLDAFNVLNPVIAMGSGEWDEHTKLMNDVASACKGLASKDYRRSSEVEATLRSSLTAPNKEDTMRSRLDDLSISVIETCTKHCPNCNRLYIFEEAHVTRQGRFLEIMLLCPECGYREKLALHSWYERRSIK